MTSASDIDYDEVATLRARNKQLADQLDRTRDELTKYRHRHQLDEASWDLWIGRFNALKEAWETGDNAAVLDATRRFLSSRDSEQGERTVELLAELRDAKEALTTVLGDVREVLGLEGGEVPFAAIPQKVADALNARERRGQEGLAARFSDLLQGVDWAHQEPTIPDAEQVAFFLTVAKQHRQELLEQLAIAQTAAAGIYWISPDNPDLQQLNRVLADLRESISTYLAIDE